MLDARKLLILLVFLLSPGYAQEPWPVPLTHQADGLLYFEAGALQGPRSLTWIAIPNQSKHPLYVAMGRDLLYNVLISPNVATVDEKGALALLKESNPKIKVNALGTTRRTAPVPGVVLDYRLGKTVLGSLFLGKDKNGQVVAVMAEGNRFVKADFVAAMDSFQPGAKPPKEWENRAPRPSKLVTEGVAHLQPLYFRVPAGFDWQESSEGEATMLLGVKKKPFTLLAARVVPSPGRALNDQAAVEGSEGLLKAMITAHTGIAFRVEQRTKLSTPLPDSWVLTAKGQTLTGQGLPARVFLGFGDGFQVALVAAGASDTMNLSLMHNSLTTEPLHAVAQSQPAAQVLPSATPSSFIDPADETPPGVVANTLIYVSLILCFCAVVMITGAVAIRNMTTQSPPVNPFAIGLKSSAALCLLQIGVSLWLLRSEGATPEDYQTYLLASWAGMAVCLIPAGLLSRRWKPQ